MSTPNAAATPSTVTWLGYGGLIPFVTFGIASRLGGDSAALATRALIAYGAVILSFVGALHWGFAMTLPALAEPRRRLAWVWSVIPPLLAWVALLLVQPRIAGGSLIVGFIAQYGQDRDLARSAPLPAWYLPLRLRLTVVACLSLLAGAAFATA